MSRDSDSRCGLGCNASARNAKPLAMWVERCKPLSSGGHRRHPPHNLKCGPILYERSTRLLGPYVAQCSCETPLYRDTFQEATWKCDHPLQELKRRVLKALGGGAARFSCHYPSKILENVVQKSVAHQCSARGFL